MSGLTSKGSAILALIREMDNPPNVGRYDYFRYEFAERCPLDVLNRLGQSGFELVDVFSLVLENNYTAYIHTFKRVIADPQRETE